MKHSGSVILAFCVLLAACLPQGARSPSTQEIANAQTAAVQTVMVRFTLEAGQTAVSQLTQIANQITDSPYETPVPSTPTSPTTQIPSPTSVPFTPTSPPTYTPSPTSIPLPATSSSSCDQADFIQNITIPPDTTVLSGSRFTKTWRVRNSGTCTWTDAYTVVFTSGFNLSAAQVYTLPAIVQPGQTIDLSISMLAPASPGAYQSFWALRNASGVVFGTGANSNAFLETRVRVIQPVSVSGITLDMSVNYCTANWNSQSGGLVCPGINQDANGWALLLAQPALESGASAAYGLWTHPDQSADGWISGQYPAYRVNSGEHFLTEIGCPFDTPGCDLVFQVNYSTTDGMSGIVGRWRETFDGKSTSVDVDLSSLAGKLTQFTFLVSNRGTVANADGIWLMPRIQSIQPAGKLLLSWIREDERVASCNQLNIYQITGTSAEARAYSCQSGQQELVRASLSSDEIVQLQALIQRLKSFTGEMYLASSTQPILVSIDFRGLGGVDAADSDIRTINSFAEAIFNRIVP